VGFLHALDRVARCAEALAAGHQLKQVIPQTRTCARAMKQKSMQFQNNNIIGILEKNSKIKKDLMQDTQDFR
jgi:hypothetical protein